MTTTIQSNVSAVTTPTVPSICVYELARTTSKTYLMSKSKLLCILLDNFLIHQEHEDVIWGAIDDIFSKPQEEDDLVVHGVNFRGMLENEDTPSSEDILGFMLTKGIRPANLVQMITMLQNGNLSHCRKIIALGTLMERRKRKCVPSFYFDIRQGKWFIETKSYDAMHCERSERHKNGGGGTASDFPTLKGWNPSNIFCAVSKA